MPEHTSNFSLGDPNPFRESIGPIEIRLPILNALEDRYRERIVDTAKGDCPFFLTEKKMSEWKKKGALTVLQIGSFDLLSLHHLAALNQSRIIGAMILSNVIDLTDELAYCTVLDLAASDSIRLIVSTDTNEGIANRKSRQPEKGGSLKPILDWETRARMLAAQSIANADSTHLNNLVDLVTKHGLSCCAKCGDNECTNTDNCQMILGLQPDVVVVNSEATRTIAEMTYFKERGLLNRTSIIITRETDNEYYDDVLKGKIDTTAIINRIKK